MMLVNEKTIEEVGNKLRQDSEFLFQEVSKLIRHFQLFSGLKYDEAISTAYGLLSYLYTGKNKMKAEEIEQAALEMSEKVRTYAEQNFTALEPQKREAVH